MKKSKSQKSELLLNALTVFAVAMIAFSGIMLTGRMKAAESTAIIPTEGRSSPSPEITAAPITDRASIFADDETPKREAPMTVNILDDTMVYEEEIRTEVDDADTPRSDYCTLMIDCSTILGNMDRLRQGKESFVPSNGLILAASTIALEEGDTVFTVLKRACDIADIRLEYSWTPLYDSYYIEGINNLYEFDCGDQSGWMYKVNGVFPDRGCSAYIPKAGDVIVFCYTCVGLGADVGGSVW